MLSSSDNVRTLLGGHAREIGIQIKILLHAQIFVEQSVVACSRCDPESVADRLRVSKPNTAKRSIVGRSSPAARRIKVVLACAIRTDQRGQHTARDIERHTCNAVPSTVDDEFLAQIVAAQNVLSRIMAMGSMLCGWRR